MTTEATNALHLDSADRAYIVSRVADNLHQLAEQRRRLGRKLAWPEVERINRDSGWVITLRGAASPHTLVGHRLTLDDLRHAWEMAREL